MKIKTGDKVKLIAGKDKGKTGKVLQVLPEIGKASVEGVNLMTKHMRARRQGEKGQKIQFPSPIDLSNLQLICPKCNKETRLGSKYLEDEIKGKKKKARFCKKCKEVI